MISVNTISKSFGKLTVLDGVSFEVREGGVFAVLGPNGSGKTTLLKILLGMVVPDKGKICYLGEDISTSVRYRKYIGYLPQIARFPENLTVQELIEMIGDIRNEPYDPNPLIDMFGMQKFLNKKLGNLSGGTRQKVNIILTFMFDTPVIVLDEPTAGLDPIALIKLKQLISSACAAGKIILITSHIMSLVEELADEIIFLLEGKIYFKGKIDSLKAITGCNDLEHSIASILEK